MPVIKSNYDYPVRIVPFDVIFEPGAEVLIETEDELFAAVSTNSLFELVTE